MQQCVVHVGADMKAKRFFYEEDKSKLVDDEKGQEDVQAVDEAQHMQHQHDSPAFHNSWNFWIKVSSSVAVDIVGSLNLN